MDYRTDLAMESVWRQHDTVPDDVTQEEERIGEAVVHRLTLGKQSATHIDKQPGRYVTVQLPPLTDNGHDMEEFANVIAKELTAFLPKEGTVLVVGLGNEAITPDALGPRAANMILATRHIQGEIARSMQLSDLRSVAVLIPGVLGNTGIESKEQTVGICSRINPSAVIALDALAAGNLSRLGCTVQLSDTGIAPGSGVQNNRQVLNRESLGIPVVGIGVPTVVDAATVARDLTGTDGGETVTPRGSHMMVTPREIDLMISRAAKLLALAINGALQPNYAPMDLLGA